MRTDHSNRLVAKEPEECLERMSRIVCIPGHAPDYALSSPAALPDYPAFYSREDSARDQREVFQAGIGKLNFQNSKFKLKILNFKKKVSPSKIVIMIISLREVLSL